MKLYWKFLALIFLVISTTADSQTLTRVTDPVNPITTDSYNSGGGSWIDINNDGLLDLFVSNGNAMSRHNALYLNTGNGNFVAVVSGNIFNDLGSSIGSTWGDY